MTTTVSTALSPPLKWAGGKRWLAKRHNSLLPDSFKTYVEPFIGGGAVFFHIQPKRAILSDVNSDLIETYKAIKTSWRDVQTILLAHAALHDKDYFYEIRGNKPRDPVKLAAWFLYMNRACYNGLYRVNQKGEFNVPKGTKDTIIFPYDNFKGISKALKRARISHADFEVTLDAAKRGDFAYLDPPYTVRHNNNGFVKYNEEIFSWSDQERLSKAVVRAADRGVKLLVSNADHSSVRDLYVEIGETIVIGRYSIIGGGVRYRSQTSEIAVKIGY